MEEGTIFNNTNPSSGQPLNPSPAPPSQPPPLPQQQPPPPPQQPSAPTSPPPPPPEFVDQGNGLPIRKLLKIGGIIAIVLALLLIVFVLILPRLSKPNQENVTLTYWGLWEDQNIMNSAIDEFERENPQINVEYEKQDVKEYRDKLSFRIPNGNGPDIFRFHNSWYPMISELLIPLPEEVITREEFDQNYYKVIKTDLIRNGAIYGIPLGVDTLAMFVNTSILEEGLVPTSWQDFIGKSQGATTRSDDGKIDISGAAIGTYENIAHAPDLISLLLAQNGVNLNDITKSESKVHDALSFYTNFALLENNVWDSTLEPSLLYFSKGKVAMVFGYSWDLFTIKALSPDLSVKVFPVPQLVQDKKVNLASYWAEGVSSKSLHQKEAFMFMKFLAKKETQEKLFTEAAKTRPFGEPYSNVDLLSSLSDSMIFVHADQAQSAVSSPFVDSTFDNGLNDKMNKYLKDAINSILSNGSVESSTKTLFDGFTQVKGQYGN